MAPDPGPLWNHRGGQQRLGYSSLEFLTDLAAAFGPKRVFSSVEWVMKLISKKKKKGWMREGTPSALRQAAEGQCTGGQATLGGCSKTVGHLGATRYFVRVIFSHLYYYRTSNCKLSFRLRRHIDGRNLTGDVPDCPNGRWPGRAGPIIGIGYGC